VAPSSLASAFPGLDKRLFYDVASDVLSIIAWIFITLTVRKIMGFWSSVLVGIVLSIYAVVGVIDTVDTWSKSPQAPSFLVSIKQNYFPPPEIYEGFLDYLFAALKCTYTFLLGCIVAYVGMPAADREAGLGHWICLFLKIKGPRPQAVTAQP
jgi:hypothetical protein